jgi:lysophospholipase L1-like esterase
MMAGLLLTVSACVSSSSLLVGAADQATPFTAAAALPVETIEPPPSPSPSVTAQHQPVAVFLGDSYTSGWKGVGSGANSWATIVTDTFGGRMVNLAVPGTGFVRGGIHGGTEGDRVGRRLSAAIAAQPTIVFLAAGFNDASYPRSRVLAAARDVVFRLRAALPTARIVVIGPWWPGPDATPPATLLALRDQLHTDAIRIGALFIDPYAEGWFRGANRQLIGTDQIHPTTLGYRTIAQRVLLAMEEWRVE